MSDAAALEDGHGAAVVASLAAVFASGRTRPLRWRLGQLAALDRFLVQEAPAIEEALARDLGRPAMETFLAEILQVRREVRTLRRGLGRWVRTQQVRVPLVLRPARSAVRHEPLGTVLVIAPWNAPINLAIAPLAAALAAGNCVIVKPSEITPRVSRLLASTLPRYVDAEAVKVVEGGAPVVEAVIDAGVDHVFFTGNPRVGRLIMGRAARRLTPVTLELGGKCPAIVDREVDVAVAARRIAWGKLFNAGQSCVAPDYVLVDRENYAALSAELVACVRTLYGDDPFTSSDYGRIVSDSHVERLCHLLEGHDGTVLVGGVVDRSTRYVAPTVIARPDPMSPLMQEEIFGPILPVLPVDNLEAAIDFLRDRPAPLALYFFSEDAASTARMLDATRSGTVGLNTVMQQFASSHLPFGGIGESGTGVYHGRFGVERLSQPRPVFSKSLRFDPARLAQPPFTRATARLLRGVLEVAPRVAARFARGGPKS